MDVGKVVLFGGSNGSELDDTWEYHVYGNACTSDDDCAQGAVCRDGACVIPDESDAGADGGDEEGVGVDAGTDDESEAESDDAGCSRRTAGGHGDGNHAAWLGIGMAVAMFARRRRESV